MTLPATARGLSPQRIELRNGAVALVQTNDTAPAVAINVTFHAGSARDSESFPGLAYLTSLLIDKGTADRTADRISDELDDRGVALRTGVTRHTFVLVTSCLAVDFDEVLRLVLEIATRPSFPNAELEKRRAEALTVLRQDADNTAVQANESVMQLLYGADHPYARPGRGTEASLQAITREAIVDYHASYLRPAVLRVAVVGDVVPAHALDAIAAALDVGGNHAPPPEVVPTPPPGARRSAFVEMPGKPQSDIAYGFTAVPRVDPRFIAYWCLNNILGQFGLGGRLAQNIREEQGMAYYAFSTFDGTVGEGPLVVRAGVDPRNVERTIAAIDREVEQLHCEGPTRAELDDTRESLIGSIPRLLENNEGIAEFLQTVEQFDLGLDYDRRLPDLLRAVTLEDVREAAAGLLDVRRAAVSVAGPTVPPA
jgi:zinc protease